jgi:uncharacterized protein YkwD
MCIILIENKNGRRLYMKKFYTYSFAILLILILVGCQTQNPSKEDLTTETIPTESNTNIKDNTIFSNNDLSEIESETTTKKEEITTDSEIKETVEETTKKEEINTETETTTKKEEINTETTTSKKNEETSTELETQIVPEYNLIDVSYNKYTTCSLNVRDYPGTSGNKIGSLPINTNVSVKGECNNGWVKIEYNNVDAFVKSSYLSDNKTIISIPEPQPETNNTITVAKEGTYDYNLGKEAFDIVNQNRINNGLSALTWDDSLYNSAKVRSAEASISWSHTRPDGSHWSTVSSGLHGENLAKGYDTAQAAVDAWMASQGHKANILRSEFTRGAVAFFNTSNGWFWCQHFGY